MDRFRTMALCLMIVLACGGTWSIAGQQAGETLCIPIGDITIAAPDDVTAKRTPVVFPHSDHFNYQCQTCHHQWENDADLNGCMACHELTEAPAASGGGPVDPQEAIMYYKQAYHTLCIGCHKQIKKKNKMLATSGKVLKDKLPATGPTGCVGCHPRP